MHRVLLIQEVVYQIIDNLRCRRPPGVITKKTMATLLNVALTCRSFLGPGLDALWYSINDLTVLFKLLPNFIPSDGTKPGIIWDRILEPNIRTFDSYASRVQCYGMQERTPKIDISAFISILNVYNRLYLLPNLKYLFPNSSGLDAPELMFLMSPQLQGFKFSPWNLLSWPSPTNLTSPNTLLDSLRKLSPDLIVLELPPIVLDALNFSALNALKRLEELSIYHTRTSQTAAIDVEFLLNISSRLTLRRLSLGGEGLELTSLSTLSIMPNSIDFPALETIAFTCRLTMASLNIFLCSATFPVLERWVIFSHGQLSDEADHWHRFFDSIGNATTNRFNKLILHHPGSTPTGSKFSNLPKISNLSLTTFRLNTAIFDSLGRQDILTMINAWPRLVDLQLLRADRAPNLDFSMLIDIARGLPCLAELELSIDSRHLPSNNNIPILSHKLVSLELSLFNCNVGQARDIAQLLDWLFPYLRRCNILADKEDDGQMERWDEVKEIMLLLRKARAAEWSRIGN